MEKQSVVEVRVPASSANLGPGFDALGLALKLYLRCTLRRSRNGFTIRASGNDREQIACDRSNLVWRAFLRLAADETPEDLDLRIVNGIPLGKGLGSSAAAIVAGLALANAWFGLRKSKEEIILLATAMEGHPDNVATAVRGGLVASCQAEDGRVLSANSPFAARIKVLVVVPEIRLPTSEARAVLPAQYSRRDAIYNLQRVALLLTALRDGRKDLLSEAMRDRLHQPYRSPLVPGFAHLLRLNGVPGLLGLALSGAGPSIVAFCDSHPRKVGAAIVAAFREGGVKAKVYEPGIDREGLQVQRLPGKRNSR